ncbi:DEAD/DEAH box helicase [Schwartzia sp. (in: firmicutes)]|nr:DEAD/DEAH box helicase [Schwartzia sp. (in: firmicutes)]
MLTFEELGIRGEAVKLLKHAGIHEATPVQEKAVPVVRGGNDAIVQAPTGTGKTLAFLLPLLERMKSGVDTAQTLIVTPTRELTRQIGKVAQTVCPAYDIRSLALYGGQDIEKEKERLGRHPQLVIGTPGRLLDHIRRKTLQLSQANKVVLDEADEMMKLGFLEDVEVLLKALAADRQLLLFSATIPDRVRALAHRYMVQPQEIKVEADAPTLDAIHQTIIDSTEETKLDQLCEIINTRQPYLMMVFCMTKQRVHQVMMALAQRGYLVDELHGDLTQAQRNFVMKKFRSAELQILVTTDIAARGLDIEGVTHVVNYDIPRSTEDYIHRIGRTGRAGREGEAITFVNARQYDKLRAIEAGIRKHIVKQRSTRSREKAKAREQIAAKIRKERQEEKKKKAKPLSKYANRKGAEHKGRDMRSRRNPSARHAKPAQKKRR